MKNPVELTKTIDPVRDSVSRPPLRLAFLLISILFGCFGLSPAARAVNPQPDGGYPVQNTAEGENALFRLTIGRNNTALGFHALFNTTAGVRNTATGQSALFSNTTGHENTATGDGALFNNTTGTNNIAVGESALFSNTTGQFNTVVGAFAALSNTTGERNIAIGLGAGAHNTTGNDNITIATDSPDHGQFEPESATIRLGNQGIQTACFIAGISGATVAGGVPVVVDSDGLLGTVVSSERFKDAIKPMDKASEAILALQPVTFRYKHELDPKGIPQFGLVAEQVEKVNPALVARDKQGKPYTVRYEAVNAMLLNEFLKEHRTVQELKSTAVKQEATIAKQQKQIEALTAGLQKVSNQLELSKPAPRTVLNNQ